MQGLTISGLDKSYGSARVLRDVSLALRPGEVHALMGENGAGKSTLIKALAGVIEVDAMTVKVDGAERKLDGPADAAALGLRFLHQELNIVPALSVAENILMSRRTPRRFGCLVDWPIQRARAADALAQGITSPWSPEADVYFRALFVESVLKHPIGFVKSVMFRLPLALIPPLDWGYENPCKTRSFTEFKEEGEDRYAVVTKRFTYVLSAYWDRLLFAAINSVAIIAILIFLYREKERRWLILFLLAPHVYNIITHLVTHIEPRFMLPTIYGYLLVLAYWAAGLLKKGNP
jgi:ABC-type sugar transport system ATPase subunit